MPPTLTISSFPSADRPSKYYCDLVAPYTVSVDEEVTFSIKMKMTEQQQRKPFHIEKHPDLTDFEFVSTTIAPDQADIVVVRLRNVKVRAITPYRYEWSRREFLHNHIVTIAEGTPILRVYAHQYQEFAVKHV